jgi:hypothetical protein
MRDKKSFFPGIVLIAIGFWFLSQRLPILQDHWDRVYPFLLLVCSALFFIDAIRRDHNPSLFWGTGLAVIGGYTALLNFGLVGEIDERVFWPLILVVIGICFLIRGLTRKEW